MEEAASGLAAAVIYAPCEPRYALEFQERHGPSVIVPEEGFAALREVAQESEKVLLSLGSRARCGCCGQKNLYHHHFCPVPSLVQAISRLARAEK